MKRNAANGLLAKQSPPQYNFFMVCGSNQSYGFREFGEHHAITVASCWSFGPNSSLPCRSHILICSRQSALNTPQNPSQYDNVSCMTIPFGSIGRLAQDYPELKEFRLSMTYRHGENIINPSTNLIRHNHDAVSTELFPVPSAPPGEIKVFESRNPEKEARTLAKEILSLQRKGVDLSDCAMLVRTNRLVSFYSQACADFGIPISGSERPSIMNEQNRRETVLERISKKLFCFVPFRPSGSTPSGNPVFQIRSPKLQIRHPKSEMENQAAGRLNILTMHKAKGLEFRHVFIPGLKKGLFPNMERDSDLEEERRVCYVAMTRAKEALYLSALKPVSQFVHEIAA